MSDDSIVDLWKIVLIALAVFMVVTTVLAFAAENMMAMSEGYTHATLPGANTAYWVKP